jgi:hypothetical protein
MAYIGKTPTIGNFQVCDAISVVNNQAAYTMQVGGVNVSPESANHMLVSLNGILQAPTSSFTVSGSTITFASNLVTGDVIDFIQILGNVLDLGVPSDSSVSLAKLTATGTKDATTFLRGDNTFAAAGLNGWSEDGANNNLLPASASAGIYLGVNSATAANLLDDYEEGTWTPSITGATGVTNLSGSYTKVGNLVTVWLYMINGNISGSPSYSITGLPFTVDEVRSTTSGIASYDAFASNATSVLGLLSISTTTIDFLYNVNGSAWLTQNINTASNVYLSFSASYIAN